jgi:hypothetical protein
MRQQAVNGVASGARHRRHRFGPIPALDYEQGIDQVIGSQLVLTPQPARELVAPHAPHAALGKPPVYLHNSNLLKAVMFGLEGNSGSL